MEGSLMFGGDMFIIEIIVASIALFESSIGAARLLGLFAANFSLGFFLSLCSRVVQAARFLAGLVCCKAGGGAGCFRFVGGARTIGGTELRARDTEIAQNIFITRGARGRPRV